MKRKPSKKLYWLYKVLGILISCMLPIWAIYEKYPMWEYSYGTSRSVGAGSIMVLIVVFVVFRKTVFNFLIDKLNLRHAPPMAIWIVLLITSYVLVYIGNFMRDLSTVFWMGLIGCTIGTVLTYIAEHRYGKEPDDE